MDSIYYFHFDVVDKLLEKIRTGAQSVTLSLDLNLSETVWQIKDGKLVLGENSFVDVKKLESICSDKHKIFTFRENEFNALEVRTGSYYKLVPTTGAPTLEINGIKMHRSKEIDPLLDAKLKTRLVVSAKDQVLDTCGGLGYSAMFAAKAGAEKVISTEKSREVIALRNLNPWLEKMNSQKIVFLHTDIVKEIDTFGNNLFNSVIHDPPRFTSASGDLYGKKFYDALFRVMAPRSKLFHYTGSPKKIRERDRFIKNTMKRLEQSGFTSVCFKDSLQGIYAKKNIT